MGGRRGTVLLPHGDRAKVRFRLDKIVFDRDACSNCIDALVEVAVQEVQVAEVVVGPGVLRIEPDCGVANRAIASLSRFNSRYTLPRVVVCQGWFGA